ncbi:MAG: hypothetical protein EWM73_03094 [Nitrospira sp.]|nr:MAG: hypothetical protein EWM73_03094 [Nitrospira sp.]
MPQTNLVDKPPQVRNATEQGFGASGILLASHGSYSLRMYDFQTQHRFKWVVIAIVVKQRMTFQEAERGNQ